MVFVYGEEEKGLKDITDEVSRGEAGFIQIREMGKRKAPVRGFFVDGVPEDVQQHAIQIDGVPLDTVGEVVAEKGIIDPHQSQRNGYPADHRRPEFTSREPKPVEALLFHETNVQDGKQK